MELESSSVLTRLPGSVSVSLHPLVVLNISEHFTRVRVQADDRTAPIAVFGALLGSQKGRSVEICNSFELVVSLKNGRVVLDHDYLSSKEEQFKQVFSTMEFLGWYTIGGPPSEDDVHFHKQICADNDNGLLLKLNPGARTSQLPVSIYESLIEIVEGQAKILFTPVVYSLATEEAERIGVDHIARSSVAGTTLTSVVLYTHPGQWVAVSEQLSAQHGAVKMLHSRVRVILDYLKAVKAGDLPRSQEVLREISSLCDQLPVLDGKAFQKDFQGQANEVLLMAYLAAITKGVATGNEFVTKINMIYDRHGVGRRARGLLF